MGSLGLHIGLKALLSSQAGLENVGHNVANASTPGYSRQTLNVSASAPILLRGLRLGTGVEANGVMRTVDALLQQRLVTQTSALHRVQATLAGLSQMEGLLDASGGGLGGLIGGLYEAFGGLAADPTDGALKSGLVQAAQSVTGQLNQLASGLSAIAGDTEQQVALTVGELNARAQELAHLNAKIATTEAGGAPANDLRDQRDLLVQSLAQLADVKAVEHADGRVQVTLGGQLLVGKERAYELRVEPTSGGQQKLWIEGGKQPVAVAGGALGGLLELSTASQPTLAQKLDALAHALIHSTNAVHSTGVPAGGGFASLLADNALEDQDGDGSVDDELLAQAGLPFDVGAGVLYVHVGSSTSEQTHTLAIDPATTTVGKLVEQLNAIEHLSASVDPTGGLRIQADGGWQFSFASKTTSQPNASGSFGGAHASLGAATAEPYALAAGDTLDFVGPLGPVSVTLSAASFADIGAATASELAQALQAAPGFTASGLQAVANGGRLYVQTQGGGTAASLTVASGSGLAALGWTAGTTTSGSAHSVAVSVGGTYAGSANELLNFVPSQDGTIGTTAGLSVLVYDASGAQIATLAVGAGYQPGTALALGNGLTVSFGYGDVSATDNDAFAVHALADADTSDVLVALGLNSFFTGSDASDIALREALADDPDLIAGSYTGAAGDNGALTALAKLSEHAIAELGGQTIGEAHGALVAELGFDVAAAKDAHELEELLAASLESRRAEVSGVNLDEELVRMVELEQAYAAAAQLIQVVNQLHDELLRMI